MTERMTVWNLSVTKNDLDGFTDLLKFFCVYSLDFEHERSTKDEFFDRAWERLSDFEFLTEPFVSARVAMSLTDTETGTLTISGDHLQAYKVVCSLNFAEMLADTEDGLRILSAQNRLVQVLENAKLATERADGSFEQSPSTKEFMN